MHNGGWCVRLLQRLVSWQARDSIVAMLREPLQHPLRINTFALRYTERVLYGCCQCECRYRCRSRELHHTRQAECTIEALEAIGQFSEER
jgi:hypothetical protein